MRNVPNLPLLGVATQLLLGSTAGAAEQPKLVPTRDVEIVYDVKRPGRSLVRERVRWLASQLLERIDGPGESATIVDMASNEVALLNHSSRTFVQTNGAMFWPLGTAKAAEFGRGADVLVAGLPCTEWMWNDDGERRAACITSDGVVLRIIDGGSIIEARSVSYGSQDPNFFQIPPGYAPALMAPETSRLLR